MILYTYTMRRFVLLAVLLCFSLFLPQQLHAVSPTVPPQVPTPRVACGIAEAQDPELRKCCGLSQSIVNNIQGSTGGVDEIIPDPIRGMWNGVFSLVGSNPDIENIDVFVPKCNSGFPSEDGDSCVCLPTTVGISPQPRVAELCEQYIRGDENSLALGYCIECSASGGYYSGIGCVPLNLSTFIGTFLLRIGIGIAGIIALGCIIYSSILIQVSRGNAENIQKAREQIVSCVIGLLLIILSVFIIQVIGVDILRLPGIE